MSRKVILCRCEDVTLADVEHAVARLRRHRGGQALHRVRHRAVPGQGVPAARSRCALAEASGRAPATIAPFTTRPPLAPTPLGLLAGRGAPRPARRAAEQAAT